MMRLFTTSNSSVPLIARVALAGVILPHGLQKTLGLFGGYGFGGTVQFFTEQMGLPVLVAIAVILTESLGAVLLLAGALSRISAALIGAVMIGAVVTMHWQHGFFMDWFGSQGGQGFEYHLLALGLAAIAVVEGGGRWSVDGLVSSWLRGRSGHEAASPALRRAT